MVRVSGKFELSEFELTELKRLKSGVKSKGKWDFRVTGALLYLLPSFSLADYHIAYIYLSPYLGVREVFLVTPLSN